MSGHYGQNQAKHLLPQPQVLTVCVHIWLARCRWKFVSTPCKIYGSSLIFILDWQIDVVYDLVLKKVWFSHESLVKVYTSHLWSSINWLYCFSQVKYYSRTCKKCLSVFIRVSQYGYECSWSISLREAQWCTSIYFTKYTWMRSVLYFLCTMGQIVWSKLHLFCCPTLDRLFCRPSFKHTLRLTFRFRDIFYNNPRSSFFYESYLLPPDCVQGIVGRRTQT